MRRLWWFIIVLVLGTVLSTGAAVAATASGSGHFTPGTSMNTARGYFSAIKLLSGQVLVAGGYDGSILGLPFIASAEIYHPASATWTPVAPMEYAVAASAAVRLANGNVLMAGGVGTLPQASSAAEIYHPKTNTWTATGSLNIPRDEDLVTALLPGGRVLVAGGYVPAAAPPFTPLASSEIWNPKTGQWTMGRSMHMARGESTSVTLKNGNILVVGGEGASGTALKSCEIYHPKTGKWSYTASMHYARFDEAAVVLHNGRVLVAGGGGASGQPITQSEIYNPNTRKWTLTGSLHTPRSESEYAIVLMPNNKVLLAGGYNTLGPTETDVNTAEVYNPKTGKWTDVATTMSASRSGHAAVLLNGKRGVLVMGGAMGAATATTDIFHW